MACALCGLCSWKVVLVVLVVVGGNSVATGTPHQVCFNKINSSPQAPPPLPLPTPLVLKVPSRRPRSAWVRVDLRVAPSDLCLLVGRIGSQVLTPPPPQPGLARRHHCFFAASDPVERDYHQAALHLMVPRRTCLPPGFRFGVHPTTSGDGNPHILW
jgi:hypothetical protein